MKSRFRTTETRILEPRAHDLLACIKPQITRSELSRYTEHAVKVVYENATKTELIRKKALFQSCLLQSLTEKNIVQEYDDKFAELLLPAFHSRDESPWPDGIIMLCAAVMLERAHHTRAVCFSDLALLSLFATASNMDPEQMLAVIRFALWIMHRSPSGSIEPDQVMSGILNLSSILTSEIAIICNSVHDTRIQLSASNPGIAMTMQSRLLKHEKREWRAMLRNGMSAINIARKTFKRIDKLLCVTYK